MTQITSSKAPPTRKVAEGAWHFARTAGKPGRLFHKFGGILAEFWAGEPLLVDGSNRMRPGAALISTNLVALNHLLLTGITTAQRDAIAAIDGMIVYNSSTNTFNFYQNGSWVTGSGLT